MGVTMKEIAKLAGVHQCTVSMVLNGYTNISPKTKKRILDLVKKLNYQPNISGRRLSKQRTYAIGVFIPIKNMRLELTESISAVLSGVGSAAKGESEYDIILQSPQEGRDQYDFSGLFSRGRIDGAVMCFPFGNEEHYAVLAEEGYPAVCVRNSSASIDYVQIDNPGAIEKIMDHLCGLGHTAIGFLASVKDVVDHRERFEAYRKLSSARGLRQMVGFGLVNGDGGYEAMKQLLPHNPTAVVTCGDLMAAGAMEYIKEKGLSVPGDISVTGFDDLESMAKMSPSLTTIRQPYFDMGREAVSLLIRRIEGKAGRNQQKKVFPAELIVRKSTAPPRGR